METRTDPRTPSPSPNVGPQAQAVQAFLACKRIALVGVSREKGHFSRALLKEMRAHGLDVALVNPKGGEIDGERVFASLEEVTPPVQAAYLATPPAATLGVMKTCEQLGIDKLWLHRGAGAGAVSPEAADFAARSPQKIVLGQCILMFLEPAHWVHRLHRGIKRITGTLPS